MVKLFIYIPTQKTVINVNEEQSVEYLNINIHFNLNSGILRSTASLTGQTKGHLKKKEVKQ